MKQRWPLTDALFIKPIDNPPPQLQADGEKKAVLC